MTTSKVSKSALSESQIFEFDQAVEYVELDHPFDAMINVVTLLCGTGEDAKDGPAMIAVSRDAVLEIFARLDLLASPATLPY